MDVVDLKTRWQHLFQLANKVAWDSHPGGRTLVILCDGTWQTIDQKYPTNIGKLAGMLASHQALQRVYYDAGVGTGWAKLSGGLFGAGLEENVKQAYRWLVTHYEPGDTVMAFGFSRGAYTVRDLFGFIANNGLVESQKDVNAAWKNYRRQDVDYRVQHVHMDVNLRFLGVFDTVGALGIPNLGHLSLNPWAPHFHDILLSNKVQEALHCLARDERRAAFTPTLWANAAERMGSGVYQKLYAGWHSDVGGGSENAALSDCALADMMLAAARAGALFRAESETLLRPDALAKMEPRASYGGLIEMQDRMWPRTVRDSDWLALRREAEALNAKTHR